MKDITITPARNTSLDYLRCICTAFIICIHITGLDPIHLELQAGHMKSVCFSALRVILALGVPPFFMLSGAFMIRKNITSLSAFYGRSYGRLLPWSIFFFFVGSIFQQLNAVYHNGTSIWNTDFSAFYLEWITRGGTGILWFIPALMGLYLITPLLIWLRKHTSLWGFCCLTVLVFTATEYLFIPYLNADYASFDINWLKGIFFIGHYMAGYCIYSICQGWSWSRFFNTTTLTITLIAGIVGSAIWLSWYYTPPYSSVPSLNAQAAIPVILSGLLFALFCKIRLPESKLISLISSVSIIIYLSHNYLALPIIRFGLKWTGLWETLYRDSFLTNFICYILAVPFSIICAVALSYAAQTLKRLIKNENSPSSAATQNGTQR